MGGAIIYTMTLMFWSTSPSLLREVPVANSDRSSMSVNRLEVRQEKGSTMGGDSNKERCVCSSGKIIYEATISMGTISEATDKITMVTPTTSPTSDISVQEQRNKILESLSPSKQSKDHLAVGVVKVGAQLEWAESVFETWGQEVNRLVFYNFQESNMTVLQARALGMQLVELHPPATPTTLALQLYVLSHMTHHFLNSHLWFLVATSHTYIQMRQLERVLESLDEDVPLIIGPDPQCWERKGGVAQDDTAILASRGLMKLLNSCLKSCAGHAHMEECMNDSSVGACAEQIVRTYCLPKSKVSKVMEYGGRG